MLWKKKRDIRKTVRKIMLHISSKNGKSRYFAKQYDVNQSGVSCFTAYRRFYLWYFHRESRYYAFKYDSGVVLLDRDQIESAVITDNITTVDSEK